MRTPTAPTISGTVAGVRRRDDEGLVDIVIRRGRIVEVAEASPRAPSDLLFDASGARVSPGLIDLHCHLSGGGGAFGPVSRPQPLSADDLLRAGVTRALGCIGREAWEGAGQQMLRSVAAIEQGGVAAAMFTGGLGPLPASVLGDHSLDVALVAGVIGRKIALDDDSPTATPAELRDEIVREVALARDFGRVPRFMVHLGTDMRHADAAIELLTLLPRQLRRLVVVTHLNWSRAHIGVARELHELGCHVDMTAAIRPDTFAGSYAAEEALEALLPVLRSEDRVSVSSDSNGATSHRLETGLLQVEHHPIGMLADCYQRAASRLGRRLADRVFCRNPARFLSEDPVSDDDARDDLVCAPGADAEFLLRDHESRLIAAVVPRRLLRMAGEGAGHDIG